MPLIIGEDRLIPGFEDNLVGLEVGGTKGFDITFPDDYMEESLAGKEAHFEVELRELREKVLPDLDDDFVKSMGDFEDMAELRSEIKKRLERNALDRARHEFSDKIIDYAVANATLDLPDVLIDQEVEVMHDEFRGSIARQGISEEAYLKVTGKTDADLHADFRPDAEKRVKVLLVLSKIAEAEGVTVDDADVEAEVAARSSPLRRATRSCSATSSPSGAATSSARHSGGAGRWSTSSTSGSAAHPDHPAIPHVEDGPSGALDSDSAASSAAIDATDPGSILEHEDGSHHHVHDHDHGDHDHAEHDAPSRPHPPADPLQPPAHAAVRHRETPDARADGDRVLQPGGARL